MRNVWNKLALAASLFVLTIAAIAIRAAAPTGGAALSRATERAQAVFQRGKSHAATALRTSSEPLPGLPPQSQKTDTPRRTGNTALPRPARFREAEGRGLLVRTWVNGAGPYSFAVDTGAGANILSRRVAAEARVAFDAGRVITIGGLSGRSVPSGRGAQVRRLSVGEPDNFLPMKGLTIVADGLPQDLDGILDPTEAFSPLGYVLDLPGGWMSAFDPRLTPLRRRATEPDEAIVSWLSDGASRRPFVSLAGGRRALLDTGSGFGLALTPDAARAIGVELNAGREQNDAHDLTGGRIAARRIRPASVSIGELALRRVPTDLLLGARADAPLLLGRDALRPFQLTFDPVNRLIRIKAD